MLNLLEKVREEKAEHCTHDELYVLRNAIFDACVLGGNTLPIRFIQPDCSYRRR
jgi:hypothetical protein